MKWNVFDSVSVNSSWVSCPGGLEAAPSLEITWLGAWCALPNVIASSGLVYWVLLCVLAWQGGLILSAAGVTGWGHAEGLLRMGVQKDSGTSDTHLQLESKKGNKCFIPLLSRLPQKFQFAEICGCLLALQWTIHGLAKRKYSFKCPFCAPVYPVQVYFSPSSYLSSEKDLILGGCWP